MGSDSHRLIERLHRHIRLRRLKARQRRRLIDLLRLRFFGRKLILVTKTLSHALEKVGEAPTEKLIEIEKEEAKRFPGSSIQGLSEKQLNAMLNREICPRCGSKGSIGGFEGGDGDEMHWFECSKCGLFEEITGL